MCRKRAWTSMTKLKEKRNMSKLKSSQSSIIESKFNLKWSVSYMYYNVMPWYHWYLIVSMPCPKNIMWCNDMYHNVMKSNTFPKSIPCHTWQPLEICAIDSKSNPILCIMYERIDLMFYNIAKQFALKRCT